DEVPRRNRPPGRLAHRLPECTRRQRLLHSKHDLGSDRIDVTRKVIGEIVLRQPCVALLVDVEMCGRRCRRSLLQERAEHFTLVEAECRDVNETGDVWRFRTERGHYLPAI